MRVNIFSASFLIAALCSCKVMKNDEMSAADQKIFDAVADKIWTYTPIYNDEKEFDKHEGFGREGGWSFAGHNMREEGRWSVIDGKICVSNGEDVKKICRDVLVDYEKSRIFMGKIFDTDNITAMSAIEIKNR